MNAPVPLRIYGMTWVLPFVVSAATGRLWDAPVAWLVLVLIAGLLVALLRGSRVVWVLFAAAELAALVSAAFDPPRWWSGLLSLVSFGCLFAPSSRRFVWRRRAN